MPDPFTSQALRAELDADPAGLGYAAPRAIGDRLTLLALLNDRSGPGTATIALDSVPRNGFVEALRPGLLALAGLSAATQMKWDRILNAIYTTTGSVTIDPTTRGLLSAAIADGVLTQAQADAAWHRAGSRAEALWGAGTVVTLTHLADAFSLKS